MPPKRATRAVTRRSVGSQGVLSFNKGQQNKVTKPDHASRGNETKKQKSTDITTDEISSSLPDAAAPDLPSNTPLLVGPLPSTTDGQVNHDNAIALALSVSQLKSYWRAKEQSRLAPRVHQQDLSLGEKILREWDMSGQYGPCIGISREARWRRARRLKLDPPLEVLAVVLGRLEGPREEERAHVDVLLGNRIEIGA